VKTEITIPGACHHMPVTPEHLEDHVSWCASSTDGRPMHAECKAQIGETLTRQPVVIITDDVAFASAMVALWTRILDTLLRDRQDRADLAGPIGEVA
jgi:uncharacterized lipoprotein YmbA